MPDENETEGSAAQEIAETVSAIAADVVEQERQEAEGARAAAEAIAAASMEGERERRFAELSNTLAQQNERIQSWESRQTEIQQQMASGQEAMTSALSELRQSLIPPPSNPLPDPAPDPVSVAVVDPVRMDQPQPQPAPPSPPAPKKKRFLLL